MSNIWIVVGALGLAGVLYMVCSAGWLLEKRPGMALAFAGYVIANIGLIWDALG